MRTSAGLACVLLLALAGCGDNLKPEQAVDAAAVDAAPTCDPRAAGQVGGPCTMDAQCESAPGLGDGLCLNAALGGIGWPAGGYCVNKIDLVSADCSNGCDTDAECGAGNVCVSVEGCNACAPACCAGDECPAGQVCTDSLIGGSLGKSACLPGNTAASEGEGKDASEASRGAHRGPILRGSPREGERRRSQGAGNGRMIGNDHRNLCNSSAGP